MLFTKTPRNKKLTKKKPLKSKLANSADSAELQNQHYYPYLITQRRINFIIICFAIFFILITARLYYLQINQGSKFQNMANDNRVRSLEVMAPRGNIYDRKGKELVINKPVFNLILIRDQRTVNEPLLKKIAQILELDRAIFFKKMREAMDTPLHIPIRLLENLEREQIVKIENNRYQLPNVDIEVIPLRFYPYKNLASHLIGYLGEINRQELQKWHDLTQEYKYNPGNLIGKKGLEKIFEAQLRGEKGLYYIEVNARGYEQLRWQNKKTLPGYDLQLTLDLTMQQLAKKLLDAKKSVGAVVAVEVNSGRILTLVSTPELNLEAFVGGISNNAWQKMLVNPHKPLVNKAIQGVYPPASTYKLITAFAGLAEQEIDSHSTVFCRGYHRFKGRNYHCWRKVGHGSVDLETAISQSCDVYFYELGLKLGVDKLAHYAKLFGLNELTGIELEHEGRGLIPTSSWKKKVKKEPWYQGETLSIAIGQGFNLVTPLQLTMMTSAIANGGTLYRPYIMERAVTQTGKIIKERQPEILSQISGAAKNLRLIRKGMVAAVYAKRATGKAAKVATIKVAGKTGTAQVVRLKQYQHLREEDIPYAYRDHAWFTCFAPAENPQIAITVFVAHGLHGSSAAAPIAQQLLANYFEIPNQVTD